METQPKLFNIEPIRLPRPTIKTIDGSEVYKKIAQDIIEWESDDNDLEEVIEALKGEFSIHDFYHDDGYEICKSLEKIGYSPDSELVLVMDCTSHYVREVLQDAIKKWVVDCWITPKFKIGDKMEIEYKKEKHEGEIREIRESVAQYMFYVPAAMDKNTIGTYRDFEDIETDFFKKND